ncbi:hypothetical protein IQ07DRAFT_649734 [Pyrenochaeta sp. DS3sAY3a]|nr:hypothetical protein IQ07DRAFT_649734 [Pyrenochaeta sp. DS3sAY3a]
MAGTFAFHLVEAAPSDQNANAPEAAPEGSAVLRRAQPQVQGLSSNTKGKGKAPAKDPLAPSPSKVSKSSKKRRAAIVGGKRSSATNDGLLSRDGVLWTHQVTSLKHMEASTLQDLEKVDDQNTLLWCAKIVYFVNKELSVSDMEAMLAPLGLFDTGRLKSEKVSRALGDKQRRWQHAIMTEFLFSLVGKLNMPQADIAQGCQGTEDASCSLHYS